MVVSAAPSSSPGTGSTRAILVAGLLLGAALLAGLTYVVLGDRETRLASAQRQSQALSAGAERLLRLELRNLERALLGIAGDAEQLFRNVPAQAAPLLGEAIRGVLERHAELESIVVLDGQGRALLPGRGDPSLPRWIADDRRGRGSALHVGPPQRARGQWLLPLAMPLGPDRWVLARLRAEELHGIIAGLDTGREGMVEVLDRDGTVLAHSHAPALVGRRFPGELAGASGARLRTSHLDGVERIVAARALQGYPLMIAAGVSRDEVLAPWRRFVAAAAVLYLLYWAGLAYLLRTVRRGGAAQARLLDELARSAVRLRMAQRVGRTGTWAIARGSDHIAWSEQVSELLGLDPSRTGCRRAEFYAMVHPGDRRRLLRLLGRAWRERAPFQADYRIVRRDGEVRWLTIRGAVVAGEDGAETMTGTVVDISERMRVQARLTDAERQFRLLFERNPLPFWVFDLETLRFLEVNRAATERYGYSRDEFLAMRILDIRPPEQHAALLEDIRRPREGFDEARVWSHRRKDGSVRQVKVYSADIEFAGRPARLILAEDITELMAHQRELAWRAGHEPTTGLLNAHALAERLAGAEAYRILYVQLRGLELIEDSLGRGAGDEVRRAIARRLDALGERYGLAACMRDDEFVLAVRAPGAGEEALAALQAAVGEPVPGADSLHRLEAWIGQADFPGDGAEPAQVIDNAALAVHAARSERFAVMRFDRAMTERAKRRLQLAGRIHRALDAGEFELHFQIIRHAGDGTPAALEALTRWPLPGGGFVPPAEFIGMCEDSGQIVPLGRWALREAARAQRRLREAGVTLPIAINISLVQFLDSDLVADIQAAMAEFGLERGALHVELTESVLLNRPEQAMHTLRQLQRQGVCVSLDDFGTGFSSLSYLRHLPLDALKIDRSFVAEVDSDERNASICRALLALGHSLGLTVIAEGVETRAQYEWLRRHGCDQVQGYWFGRPAPLEGVARELRAGAASNGLSGAGA
ncbi:bifunctional diguanylate cyclase/phosphodiesterase [Vulcaniibacterium tengchongense]|uniref:PAS domain S-box-containing protein n=1 Tax=Vulcaniibacterium tengchongense TaxID=1273429 RepID=A0A3N4W164_9GAMM|nr:EAL domain-containing protein [Vulcaniibacterium tengchongense]RPE79780.1 PAS domain S-box-containing protein [Vulcaniibacterium tengchongense]